MMGGRAPRLRRQDPLEDPADIPDESSSASADVTERTSLNPDARQIDHEFDALALARWSGEGGA